VHGRDARRGAAARATWRRSRASTCWSTKPAFSRPSAASPATASSSPSPDVAGVSGVYYEAGRETVPLKASLLPESQARLCGILESLAGLE
jgi:hypothetical protein